jgi:type VI secretion system secreted protein Hcp
MEHAAHRPLRVLIAGIAALLIAAGAILALAPHERVARHVGEPAVRQLTLDDMLVLAAAAPGIRMRYDTSVMPIESFQWGVGRSISPPTGGGGHEASTPSVSEVVVTKATDRFSALLLEDSLIGGEVPVVTIIFTDLSGTGGTSRDWLEVKLENVLLSGYSVSSGGDRPTESLSLNFTKVTFTSRLNGAVQSTTYDISSGIGG